MTGWQCLFFRCCWYSDSLPGFLYMEREEVISMWFRGKPAEYVPNPDPCPFVDNVKPRRVTFYFSGGTAASTITTIPIEILEWWMRNEKIITFRNADVSTSSMIVDHACVQNIITDSEIKE